MRSIDLYKFSKTREKNLSSEIARLVNLIMAVKIILILTKTKQ